VTLPSNYIQVYGQVPEFFSKLQDGQAPDKFTQQHLKDIGYTSSNFRGFIPLLKVLKFLSSDGSPTQRYHAYRNRAEAPKVMAEALREEYSDLFLIKDPPTEKDKALIEGKFKSVHNASDRSAELMARTFLALAKIADFSGEVKKQAPQSIDKSDATLKEIALQPENTAEDMFNKSPSLHYDIKIHLPASKDVEVYNAIFKSLKEHLLG